MTDRYEIERKTLPGGHRVVVEYDMDPESPREWCNVGTIVLHTGCRYSFGDETAGMEELQEINDDPNNIVLPIYLYDHGGITISTGGFSCPWDSGQVGLIYCTKERAIKEWGKKILTKKAREQAIQCLQGEIKDLDQYLTGTVYGFRVFDPAGEEIDSCWGFYGDSEYCLSEGVASAEHHEREWMEDRRKAWRAALHEARERRYWSARGVETVGV